MVDANGKVLLFVAQAPTTEPQVPWLAPGGAVYPVNL